MYVMARKVCAIAAAVLVVLIVIVAVIAVEVQRKQKKRTEPPVGNNQKYAEALGVALQFFQVQKSGKLADSKISWRGDSALNDGEEAGLDLSKGMYDAGDHIKFGFPMAYTATVLAWSILEYRNEMSAANQLDSALDALRWITDYLINAHPSDDVLYIQVGDPEIDHNCWERPETMAESRPLTQVNKTVKGTDVAAETAAAMAAASLVFKNSNYAHSQLLLQHAQQLFAFADAYRGSYSASNPKVQTYYNSTGYGDELLWAASWLYHATGNQTYLSFAVGQNGDDFAGWGTPSWFSWDDKHAGAQVLLSRVHFFGSSEFSNSELQGLQLYRRTAEAVMCVLLPDSPDASASRTHGGLIWLQQWNALQHAAAASFLVVTYSNYMLSSGTPEIQCSGKTFTPFELRDFAAAQIDYILGNNPMKLSYLVGYGSSYPQQVHHRGASIPANADAGCRGGFRWLTKEEPNPNVAVGALVGGPFKNDSYYDTRSNSMQGEPSISNSALLVGSLSGLLSTSVLTSFS